MPVADGPLSQYQIDVEQCDLAGNRPNHNLLLVLLPGSDCPTGVLSEQGLDLPCHLQSYKEAVAVAGNQIQEQPVGFPGLINAPGIACLEPSIDGTIAELTDCSCTEPVWTG